MIDSRGNIINRVDPNKVYSKPEPKAPEPVKYESGQLDLITPITFEGRTFIPLVELAKIHFGSMYNDLEYRVEPSTNGGYVNITRREYKPGWGFAFSNHTAKGSFRLQMNWEDVLVNQLKMFAYLHRYFKGA